MLEKLRKKKDARFNLGEIGKDILSHFEGVIEARAEYITGCDQYKLKALALQGKEPAEYWADEGVIEILGKGVSAKFDVKATKAKYELGKKVRDKSSGFEGILYSRIQFLTGEDRYVIVAEALPGKEPAKHWVDEGLIEILEKKVVKPIVQDKNKGGPKCVPSGCRL